MRLIFPAVLIALCGGCGVAGGSNVIAEGELPPATPRSAAP